MGGIKAEDSDGIRGVNMQDIKLMCEKLWNYTYQDMQKESHPIVVMAPDCSQKNKLRVYANG